MEKEKKMSIYVLDLREIDKTKIAIAGGKAANLGELFKIEGIHVPEGFCITTSAYKKVTEGNTKLNKLLDELSLLKADEHNKISEVSAEIRDVIEGISIPKDIAEEISRYIASFGENNAYAVRSSATAEDLPTASFAGQQDTYLNIAGKEEIIKHISKCWTSLFTDRAVAYRIQNGYDHHKVYLSVIIQEMVFPQAAGILFTADPITSNRKITSIDAGFGLGEAMVSGIVNADNYKLHNGLITGKKIPAKEFAIYAVEGGGTKKLELATEEQHMQVLTDEQILQLDSIGKDIEKHFGSPQDIEWCLADDMFYIVQSRPITTLFPVPETNDNENHVYVSVGHQQMMTDPMKPLGLSLWQLMAARPMYKAGGRLFVDIAGDLASQSGREFLVNVLGKSDPLIKDAFMTIMEQDFIKILPAENDKQEAGKHHKGLSVADFKTQLENDPSIVSDLIRSSEDSLAVLKDRIQTKSGPELIDFILEDIIQVKQRRISGPQTLDVIMTAMNASFWLNEKMYEWLGEKNVADTLAQSVPNNITSEMGLELLDLADVIRQYPEVIGYLQNAKDEVLENLPRYKGGKETRDALNVYLNKYGMRCVGEIDITKTRWSENPSQLIPLILSNIKNFEAGESKRRFERGQREALKKEQEILKRLKELPAGEEKAKETKQKIELLRTFAGYREYPKYSMMSRYFVYKQAIMKEAEQLLSQGVIHEKEDIYYLSFEELREVVRTDKPDYNLINSRKDEYTRYEKLTPPRVMTSEGEIISGKYKKEHLPENAIPGLAVSAGITEGRARVILDMKEANLEEGDILVTAYTDPSWTPLFVSVIGLVTEVGGLMTHGAVIAREYGLPAVVGVEHATRVIKDGQRIRVNGTEGYVEIL